MRKFLLSLAVIVMMPALCFAQAGMIREFKPATDSLRARLERRGKVAIPLRLSKIMDRSGTLDFYFTADLAEYPWHEGDYDWFCKEFRKLFPSAYRSYTLGDIYGDRKLIRDLQMPALTSDGRPRQNSYRVNDPMSSAEPLVRVIGGAEYEKGLSGRHIALWQSHGRYYDEETERWKWQRAPLHGTNEDLFTQSFVLPFLIPMLENSGAIVITPRERDTQPLEIVCDNDPAFEGPRNRPLRQLGNYQERGGWTSAGIGFADKKEIYTGDDNPFTMGTARSVAVHNGGSTASIRWTGLFQESGRFAVYVSYKTMSNSTTCASYTVHHAGGETRFAVNQTMSGGTWVYLGTFEFRKGKSGWVELDNGVPKGCSFKDNTVVTADAVRFGGGMGKIDRGGGISGLPSYEEGALYSLQWGGIDRSLLPSDWDNEYQREYGCRAVWVNNMCGGSRVNPGTGRGVPFDLSLAFHSNAGIKEDGGIYGTLSIVQSERGGITRLPDGESRQSSRMMADLVQSQVVEDIRKLWLPEWTRMQIYDRGYHEAGAPLVPAMILEAFSHQNLSDMTYGLDPAFRFDFCRSVYKGILKYLSYRYGCNYAVQPLPVKNFKAALKGGKVQLSWEPVEDPLEPTAKAERYILYTREDGGSFDSGKVLEHVRTEGGVCTADVSLKKGNLYSFRIAAVNDGGESFPSETLCAGIPENASGHEVMVVNNFTRVSAPVWVDLPSYGGFMYTLDAGVPWGEEISYAGEVYLFEKGIPWVDDDNPGSGGCFTDNMGFKTAGNTFDFVSVHASSLMRAGCPVSSSSSGALAAADTSGIWALDIICGKQVTTPSGRNRAHGDRYEVFPTPLVKALEKFTSGGRHVIISGAYIGTDVWDRLYSVEKKPDKLKRAVSSLLGYSWITNFADRSGSVRPFGRTVPLPELRYNREFSPALYRVENADGIAPVGDKARTVLRYRGTDISAAVAYDSGTYRALSFGFPLETVVSEDGLDAIMKAACDYFDAFVKNE